MEFISVRVLAAAALCLSAAASHAQQVPGAHFIENWDSDGDGQVTALEVAEKRAALFYMFDQNEDGVLDENEYALFDETRAADMAANAGGRQGPMRIVDEALALAFNDVDADGRVSRDEFAEGSQRFFQAIDANGDGLLKTEDFRPRG